MAKRGPKGYSPEKIISTLREIEAAIAEGKTSAEAIAEQDVSHQTYYRWRRKYGSIDTDELKRLKTLEAENKRLKKLVADLSLDKDILKEALKGKY